MPKTDRTSTTPARTSGMLPIASPASPPAQPSRRGVLASAAGLLALGGATAAAPAVASGPDAALDAELIATCAEHAVNVAAYNRAGGAAEESGDDPLWLAYERTRDAISAAEPRTLEGALAKALAAKAEARRSDGSEDPADGPAAAWAWDVLGDLLRLNGRAAPSVVGRVAPAAHPDAELFALCAAHDDLERRYRASFDPSSPAYVEDDDARDLVNDPIHDAQKPLGERICAMRATTTEGARARVRSILLADAELDPAEDALWSGHSMDRRMTAAVFRDLLGGA